MYHRLRLTWRAKNSKNMRLRDTEYVGAVSINYNFKLYGCKSGLFVLEIENRGADSCTANVRWQYLVSAVSYALRSFINKKQPKYTIMLQCRLLSRKVGKHARLLEGKSKEFPAYRF